MLDLQNHFIDEGLNKHIKMYNRVGEQIEKLIMTLKQIIMNYRTDKHLTEFKFWSGAKQHYFTYAELQQLDKNLTELFCEKTPTETDINDLFWFEEELLCELIGTDFNEYENR